MTRMSVSRLAMAAALLASATGLTTANQQPDIDAVHHLHAQYNSGLAESPCDPLVPGHCTLPFPNSFFLAVDANKRTGYSVNLTAEGLPKDRFHRKLNPKDWNELDGFSPLSSILTHFDPPPVLDNVPQWWNISASLSVDCPTVLLDAQTGERLPHWAEIDRRDNNTAATAHRRAFIIWPIQALNTSRRYIVALRNLKQANGSLLEPSPAFEALRDNQSSTDPAVNNRRPLFEDIFHRLEAVGVKRSELQLAWDFVTGSDDSLHSWALDARDDALDRLPTDGVKFQILSTKESPSNYTYLQVTGEMQVPMYLTTDLPTPTARLVIIDNKPQFQRWGSVQFMCEIPVSLVENGTAGPGMMYGHGLLGHFDELTMTYLRADAYNFGYIICGVDWWGMAEFDVPTVVEVLTVNPSGFRYIPDRLTQAMINWMYLGKLLKTSLKDSPYFQANGKNLLDPQRLYYFGNSQGGIMGGVMVALNPDLQTAVLGVAGAPYDMLLPRSADFSDFWEAISVEYPDELDRMVLIALFQMPWDRCAPASYAGHITHNTFRNTPPKTVAIHYGLGDAQVTWLGALSMARSMGAKMFPNSVHQPNEDFFGFEIATEPVTNGATIQGWDFGAPPTPRVNQPPSKATDTHECPRRDPRAQHQMATLFATGQIIDHCDGKGCHPLQPPLHLHDCPLPDLSRKQWSWRRPTKEQA